MVFPVTRRVFLATLAAAPLSPAAFWSSKPFPEWSEEEIDKMLTDSPWAKSMTVRFELNDPRERQQFDFSDVGLPQGAGWPGIPGIGGQRGGSTGGPGGYPGPGGGSRTRGESVQAEAYLTIRWSSALPIKQAILLDRFGVNAATRPEAVEILNREESDYIVEIFGLPAMVVHEGPERLREDVLETASLVGRNGGAIRPSSVDMPVHGEYLSATVRFPRAYPITMEDRQVEFRATAGAMDFRSKFKLKQMVYEGRLEL